MPLSYTANVIDLFKEPWKTLVRKMVGYIRYSKFPCEVILGNWDFNDDVNSNAWSLVGISPDYGGFLECHLTSGKEKDTPFWITELRDVIPVLYDKEDFNLEKAKILGGVLQKQLGQKEHHVIGMVSLHQIIKSKKSFALIWYNPGIKREIVELIMKYILDDKLKAKIAPQ